MAKIRFGPGISAARGTIGGMVYSANASGAYIRNYAKPTRPNTSAQQAVSAIFGSIARLWRQLTASQRNAWIKAAETAPYTDAVGNVNNYTGVQLFQKVNSTLTLNGLPGLSLPGAPSVLPAMLDVSVSLPGGVFTASIRNDSATPNEVPVGTAMVIQATSARSAGISAPKRNSFVAIDTLAAATPTSAVALNTAYAAKFGTPASGTKVFFQVFLIQLSSGAVNKALFGSVVIP